ncbi:MAG: T9SS type A sorting domain-containing protein [candidate division Zixibacteria bacterium]|nr:T9SS type A sorting domain-containing protein [candidate division Zixibacteria bacterium]
MQYAEWKLSTASAEATNFKSLESGGAIMYRITINLLMVTLLALVGTISASANQNPVIKLGDYERISHQSKKGGIDIPAGGLIESICDDCPDNYVVTTGGTQEGVLVESHLTFCNDEVNLAYELNFTLWQKEDGIDVNGWMVCVSPPPDGFYEVTSERTNQPEPYHSNGDNGQHAVRVHCTDGVIPRGGQVDVYACLWLTGWNTLRTADIDWEGAKSIKAAPNLGWTVDWPKHIGDDYYRHRVTFQNDDTTGTIELLDFRFRPSFDEIPIDSVFPFDTLLTDVVALEPGMSWSCDVITYGAYIGGHIYGHYLVQKLQPGDCASIMTQIFDHEIIEPPPYPEPCPEGVTVWHNGEPTWDYAVGCCRYYGTESEAWVVDDFVLSEETTISGMSWWAITDDAFDFRNTDDIIILADNNGAPGDTIVEMFDVPNFRFDVGEDLWNFNQFVYYIRGLDISLPAGTYWIGMRPVSQVSFGYSYSGTTLPITGSQAYYNWDGEWKPIEELLYGEAYDFAFCLHSSNCTGEIWMIPDDDPVIVPPGGRFGGTGYLTNLSGQQKTTDVWVGVLYQGNFYTQFRFLNLTLNPGDTISGHFWQRIPGYVPTGTYDYCAYSGDYPDLIEYECCFPFTVAGARIEGGADEWVFEGGFSDAEIPSSFMLMDAYPNPFNATTVITYELPDANFVNLEVFNLLGQKVATLVNESKSAGCHQITWDGSKYSSGIYLYKLEAGGEIATKRMTLLK